MLIIYTWLIHVKKSFRKGFCVFGTVKPNIDGHSWHIPHAMWVLFTSNWHSQSAAWLMQKYMLVKVYPLFVLCASKRAHVSFQRYGLCFHYMSIYMSICPPCSVASPVQVQARVSWHRKVEALLLLKPFLGVKCQFSSQSLLGLILTLPPACGIPIRLSLRVLPQSSWASRSIVAQVTQMPGCLSCVSSEQLAE